MTVSKMFRVASIGTLLVLSTGAAFASPQTHHCKLPDGSMDMSKTHKQCTAAKGSWAKDAATAAPATPAPAAAAPAAMTPAPAPAAK